jgi:hypothetical protein
MQSSVCNRVTYFTPSGFNLYGAILSDFSGFVLECGLLPSIGLQLTRNDGIRCRHSELKPDR